MLPAQWLRVGNFAGSHMVQQDGSGGQLNAFPFCPETSRFYVAFVLYYLFLLAAEWLGNLLGSLGEGWQQE